MHESTEKVIRERKASYYASKKEGGDKKADEEDELLGKKKRLAFLDLLIESSDGGKVLSDADIREEVSYKI